VDGYFAILEKWMDNLEFTRSEVIFYIVIEKKWMNILPFIRSL